MKKDLTIISLPVDRGGCGWYRIRQPFDLINAFTDSKAYVIEKDAQDPIDVAVKLSNADVIVVRQGAEVGIDMLRRSVQDYGKEIGEKKDITAKIVLDIDDNIELISPYSEHYKEYGLHEFTDGMGRKIWSEGTHDFYPKNNRGRVMSLMAGMMNADLVTVTTPKLAEYAKLFNEHVAVLPNFADTRKWGKLNNGKNDPLRVGWSGGISHYEDWYSVKDPLNRLMRKYNFTLVMVGTHFEGLIDPDNRGRVEIHPWVPFEAHPYHMMCMQLDVAIIPLADLPFNHYKSSIKYYEMSAMGVPSVVSNILPYKTDLIDPVNAYSYNTPQEFEEKLEKLLTNAPLRKDMGEIAYQMSRNKWDATKHAQDWVDAYRSIL